MNIFILDTDPQKCAIAYQDRHLHWGVHDTAAVLNAAHVSLDGCSAPGAQHAYLPLDTRHAMAQWTKESQSNYEWMSDLCEALCSEYTLRLKRRNFMESICKALFNNVPEHIKGGPLTRTPAAVPNIYMRDSVIESYRAYYQSKHEGAVWTWPRKEPTWWNTAKVRA